MKEYQVFKCRQCKEIIGLTDQRFLYAGGMAFSYRTKPICLYCGMVNLWKPLISGCPETPLMMDVVMVGVKNG